MRPAAHPAPSLTRAPRSSSSSCRRQRLFPDFFPSAFTESRQNVMSMYSSITSRVPSYADESDGSYFGESGGFSDLEADGATAELPDNCGMDAEPEECAQSVLGGDGSDVA